MPGLIAHLLSLAGLSVPGFERGAARAPAEASLLRSVVKPRQDQEGVVRLAFSGGVRRSNLLFQRHDALHQAHDGRVDVGVVL